jgi:hypothetical protein
MSAEKIEHERENVESSGGSSTFVNITSETILAACKTGDVALLRRWGRMGMEMVETMPLVESALSGWHLDVLRCLVKDLHADVNQADFMKSQPCPPQPRKTIPMQFAV